MNDEAKLRIDGEVDRPLRLSAHDLAALDAAGQVADMTRHGLKRGGEAVRLETVLAHVGARPGARYLTLHAAADDFHASIPLDAVRARAMIVYRLEGAPLPDSAGGPFRFFIPDHASCHADEVDECANVKFIDHIELGATRGRDNRPTDDEAHEKLHGKSE